MEGITMYGCWAHARRKFVDALQEDEKMAAEAILYIRKLYKVEEDADNAVLSPDERKEQRHKISYPTLRDFEKWMEDVLRKLPYYHRDGKDISELFLELGPSRPLIEANSN